MEEGTTDYSIHHDVVSQYVRKFGIGRMISPDNITGCPSDAVPSLPAYLSAISIYGIVLLTSGAVAVIIIMAMYIDTLNYIMKHCPPSVKTNSAFVVGVYPVVAIASYCGTVVPRAHLLAEAITQGIFMAAMYQLFCLFVAYCGGEAEFIRQVKPDSLNMKVGPCCCWPCCCLPSLKVNKNNVRCLRMLVLQLPVVQGFVYMVLLVMWAERESLYQVNYMYVQPIIIVSILCGIWSMSMTMRMLRDILKDHLMTAKFLVLQMVLIFAKLQGLTTRVVVWFDLLPCNPPITPPVYGNVIHNSLMLAEMVMLGFIARLLYKRPLPDPSSSETNNNVFTLSNGRISMIGNIMSENRVTPVVPSADA